MHLRQTGEGLGYRVGGEDGERHDVDLDQRLCDYLRLDDDIESVYRRLGRHRAVPGPEAALPGTVGVLGGLPVLRDQQHPGHQGKRRENRPTGPPQSPPRR